MLSKALYSNTFFAIRVEALASRLEASLLGLLGLPFIGSTQRTVSFEHVSCSALFLEVQVSGLESG